MAEQNIFPNTQFVDEAVPAGGMEAQLARSVYLAEDCSGGNRWLRSRLIGALTGFIAMMPQESAVELPAAVTNLTPRFKAGLAEKFVALGGLSASANEKARERRADGMLATWDKIAEAGTQRGATELSQEASDASKPTNNEMFRFFLEISKVGTGMVLTDIASMQSARQGKGERSESIFWNNVLNKRPSGSDPFDSLFLGLRQVSMFGFYGAALSKLELEWRQNDPDGSEAFYPPDYRAERQQLPAVIRGAGGLIGLCSSSLITWTAVDMRFKRK